MTVSRRSILLASAAASVLAALHLPRYSADAFLPRSSSPRAGRVYSIRAADGDDDSADDGGRRPWDVLRFVRQSSQFVTLPNPLRRPGEARVIKPGDTIWSPGSYESNPFRWAPLDDVVMGGASSSSVDNDTGLWSGTVTSANSGGFVGVRSTPFDSPLDMTSCRGVEFRLRGGDGRRFKAVVRDSAEFNGVCWTTSFDAPGGGGGGAFSFGDKQDGGGGGRGVGSVRLPFDEQVPTIFARTVLGKTFRSDNVLGFQLAYSKFEYDGALNPNFSLGDFSLQILEVRAY